MWVRARRPIAAAWEKANHRLFFSAREGNGALDVVWGQALRNERATARSQASAALLVDLSAFYEHFDHSLLIQRADKLGFPKQLTRLAVKGYRAARLITMAGKLSASLRAKRGVVAGCGMATT